MNTQALVLAPSRELAQQIAFVIQSVGEFVAIKVHACVSGTLVRDEIRKLKEGVHVVVGTPGRVHDMLKKGFLKSDYLKVLVLDDVDILLS